MALDNKEKKSNKFPLSHTNALHPFDQAFALFCEGSYVEAIECLESVANAYPPAILFLNRLHKYFPDRINPSFLRTADELEPFFQAVKHSAEKGNPGAVYDFALLSFIAQKYETAFKWLFISANLGNSHAYFLLGLCCATGKVGPKNLEKAAEYFHAAAIQGDEEAILYLSFCCFDNIKVAEKYTKWFKDLVEGGTESVSAQFYLGFCYFTGTGGVKCDPARAAEIFYAIWTRGHASAQYLLAVSFYYMPHLIENPVYDFSDFESSYSPEIHGDPSEPSNKAFFLAAKLARLAAEQGNEINAQFLLGLFLLQGIGGKQDPEEAYYWFQRAAAQGHTIAQACTVSYEAFLVQSNEFDKFYKILPQALKSGLMNTQAYFARMFVFEKLIPVTEPVSTLSSSSSSTTSMPEAKSVEIPQPTASEKPLDWREVLFGPEIESKNSNQIVSSLEPKQEAKKPKNILKKAEDKDQSVLIPLDGKNLMVREKSRGTGNSAHAVIQEKQVQGTVLKEPNIRENKKKKTVRFAETLAQVRVLSQVPFQEESPSGENHPVDLPAKFTDPASLITPTPALPLKEEKKALVEKELAPVQPEKPKSKRQIKKALTLEASKEKEKEKEKTPELAFQETDSKRDLIHSIPPISLDTAKALISKAEQGLNEDERNQLKAWFKKESTVTHNQDANSYYWLGRYCDSVTRKDKAAFDFFQKAIKADAKHAEAAYYLGLCYEQGKAYEYGEKNKQGKRVKNARLAYKYYQDAADNGHELAKVWVETRQKLEAQKAEEKAQALLAFDSDSVSSEASKPVESTMDLTITLPEQEEKIREQKSEAKSEHPGELAYQESRKLCYLHQVDAAMVKSKIAADLGHLPATLLYGIMFKSMGATQDAEAWFDKLRQANFYEQLNLDVPGNLVLSHRYRHYVLNQSAEDCFVWLAPKADEKDDPEAQLLVGIHLYNTGEYQQAISWLERARKHQVEILDPAVNTYLGLCWLNTNSGKAFEYFDQAAKQGDVIAQSQLAYKNTYEETRRLAESENMDAVVRLGEHYWRGIGTGKDLQKAEACLENAATAGHELGKELLKQFYVVQGNAAIQRYASVSDNYKTFKPEEKSYATAIHYLKKAADAGFLEANYLYAQFLYDAQQSKNHAERHYDEIMEYLEQYKKNNGTNPKTQELTAKCVAELRASNAKLEEELREEKLERQREIAFQEGLSAEYLSQQKNALQKYKEAADLGHPIAALYCVRLLRHLNSSTEEERPYVEKAQKHEAFFLENLESASPERLFLAAIYLGLCCANGWKDKKGQYSEFSCLQKAAESGHVLAQYHLGNFYQKRNSPGDLAKAFESFQKSANAGYRDADLAVAKCYRDGLGTNIDLVKAKQCYMKVGLVGGDRNALLEFFEDIFQKGGDAYERGQERVAVSNLSAIGGENGFPLANIYLGRMYETGFGVTADSKTAEFYYEKAREHISDFSEFSLAQFTQFADKSEEKAIPLYERVSKTDSDPVIRARAEYYLALCYKNTDPEKFSEYMNSAARNKNPMALYYLGCEQINLVGRDQSLISGMTHLTVAADQGHLDAQYVLAGLLCDREEKNAAVKDFSTVIKYCNLAIAHPDASKLFAKCEAAIEAHKNTLTQSTSSASSSNLICDEKNSEEIFKEGEEAFERRQDGLALSHLLSIGGENGYPPANVYLGKMYEEGWGVKKDLIIAESYYKKARARSAWFLEAGRELQLAQYNQFATKPKNPEKEVIQNYKKVIKSNRSSKESRARAQYYLGAYYSKAGEAKQAKKYYEEAANANHPSALADLGNDKTLTIMEQKEWLGKAALQQHAVAAYTMAKFFYDEEEYSRVISYLCLPALQTNASVQYLLGKFYYEERGAFILTLQAAGKEAIKLLTSAADQGHEGAMLLLGECYCRGRGVLINYEKARKLLTPVIKIWNKETGKLLKECQLKVAHFSEDAASHTTTTSPAFAVPEAKGSPVGPEEVVVERKDTGPVAGVNYGEILGSLPKSPASSQVPADDQATQVRHTSQTDWFSVRKKEVAFDGFDGAPSSTSTSDIGYLS